MTTKQVPESKPFDIAQLSDIDLANFVAAGLAEITARVKRRKEETIAKIRALAGEAGLAVSIEGARGRPGGRSPKKRMSSVQAPSLALIKDQADTQS